MKKACKVSFKLKNMADNGGRCTKSFNWRYFWRNFGFKFNGERLVDGEKELRDYGLQNRSVVELYRLMAREKNLLKKRK
jgi:hypothetical protein